MNVITGFDCLQAQIARWKQEGRRTCFIPTMGNLHRGHCALMQAGLQQADRLIVSLFVNPTQFGPQEDFSRYPRTPEDDVDCVASQGGHAVWLPKIEEIYPLGVEQACRIHIPVLSQILEGASRPGHFDGVCTVVARLFLRVQPDVAVFGRKDYQQLALIARMVDDFRMPIQIVGVNTVREHDGLALSSRNQYLTQQQRRTAAEIWQTLCWMQSVYQADISLSQLEEQATLRLQQAGFVVDYAVVRQQNLITAPSCQSQEPVVALIAARLGATRLIDNLEWRTA